ncbi:hypothetical protein KSS87_023362 [Heliosperma pusillum]|nr:hypothetical protein KSS87_023362 [Heliosperma pusillum]
MYSQSSTPTTRLRTTRSSKHPHAKPSSVSPPKTRFENPSGSCGDASTAGKRRKVVKGKDKKHDQVDVRGEVDAGVEGPVDAGEDGR